MARGVKHSEELKAQGMAALLAGQGVDEVAAQYNLPLSTVRNWYKAMDPDTLADLGTKSREKAAERADELTTLLHDYLKANLRALTAQCNVLGDEQYIRKYPPQQTAVLHGVMADKAARMVEAVYSLAGREDPDDEGPGESAEAGDGKIEVVYREERGTTDTSRSAEGD